MVTVPTAAVFASPLLLMTTSLMLEEVHVTWLVRLKFVTLLKFPVAVNCCELPTAMLAPDGVTTMVWRAAVLTVKVAAGLTTPPKAAVIVDVPGDTPRARPALPMELLMVANAGWDEVQVTEFVRSCVLPSAKVAIAVN